MSSTGDADPLRAFVERFLALHGAVAEEEDGALTAILPPELASRTGWGELERFVFDASARGRLVAYESGLLDDIRPLVDSAGAFAEARLRVVGQKTEGFESLVESRIGFPNGIYRYEGASNSEVPYLLAFYRATATSEERHDAVVIAALNGLTGSRVDGLVPWILERLSEAREVPGAVADRAVLARFAPRLAREALATARGLFASLEKGLARRLARDVERLTDYYGAIEDELRKKVVRRRLLGDERAREEARIEATRRELAIKLADQRSRYALEVRLQPIALLRVWLGATLVRLTLLRRKSSRGISLTYSYVTHDLEAPSCEGCGTPLRQVWLCDSEVHLLCPACQRCARCGKVLCRVCQPRGCRGCPTGG